MTTSRAADLWEVFGKTGQQDNFVVQCLGAPARCHPVVQDKTFGIKFSKVNPELGRRIKEATLKLSPVSTTRIESW